MDRNGGPVRSPMKSDINPGRILTKALVLFAIINVLYVSIDPQP